MTATGRKTTKIFAVLACVEIASSGLGAVFMEYAYATLVKLQTGRVPPAGGVFCGEIVGFAFTAVGLAVVILRDGSKVKPPAGRGLIGEMTPR